MLLNDAIGDWCDRLRATRDLTALERVLTELTQRLGFEHFDMFYLDGSFNRRKTLHLSNVPTDLQLQIDDLSPENPIFAASQRATTAFAWSDLPRIVSLAPDQRRFFAMIAKMGLEGYTAPLHLSGLAFGYCSFLTRSGRASADVVLPRVQYIACVAFDALRSLADSSADANDTAPALTPRQFDCLVLMARGKSDWVIGQLLGLSQETVKMHIRLAKKRFEVSSRVELVVRALYARQLSFSDLQAWRASSKSTRA
jgi:LuxR family quorum-sensing system transcriptional regulator CciR